LQDDDPANEEYPIAQLSQDTDPETDENEPAGQLVQDEDLTDEY